MNEGIGELKCRRHFVLQLHTLVETIYQSWRVTFLFMRYNEFFANWKQTKMESLLRKIDFLLM